MTRNALSVVVGAILLLVIACAAGGAVLLGGGASACAPVLPSGGASAPANDYRAPIGRFDTEQVGNASLIITVGARHHVPIRGWIIAVATAIQESRLRNLPGGDQDSIGLFQQRPSQGWGTVQQLRDPAYQAGKFYATLNTVSGWEIMTLTQAAQAVQISAYPDAYSKHEPDAVMLVNTLVSGDPSAIPDDFEKCVSICSTLSASPEDSDGACVDISAVFARAQSWLTAWSGGPVPYLSSNAPGDLLSGYRRDCSGYVSMALGLSGPGLTTIELARHSRVIGKTQLQPGNLMINPDTDLRGHVVLFAGWVDTSMTSYYGYEQTGDSGTHYREIPYPYFGSYSMTPYRLIK